MTTDNDGAPAPCGTCCVTACRPTTEAAPPVCKRIAQALNAEPAAQRQRVIWEYGPPLVAPPALWTLVQPAGGYLAALLAAAFYLLVIRASKRIQPRADTGDYMHNLETLTGLTAGALVGAAAFFIPDLSGSAWRLLAGSAATALAAAWPTIHATTSGGRLTPLELALAACGQHCAFCRTQAPFPILTRERQS